MEKKILSYLGLTIKELDIAQSAEIIKMSQNFTKDIQKIWAKYSGNYGRKVIQKIITTNETDFLRTEMKFELLEPQIQKIAGIFSEK